MLSMALAMLGASLLPQQARGGMQPGMYNQGFQRIFVTYFWFCCSVLCSGNLCALGGVGFVSDKEKPV